MASDTYKVVYLGRRTKAPQEKVRAIERALAAYARQEKVHIEITPIGKEEAAPGVIIQGISRSQVKAAIRALPEAYHIRKHLPTSDQMPKQVKGASPSDGMTAEEQFRRAYEHFDGERNRLENEIRDLKLELIRERQGGRAVASKEPLEGRVKEASPRRSTDSLSWQQKCDAAFYTDEVLRQEEVAAYYALAIETLAGIGFVFDPKQAIMDLKSNGERKDAEPAREDAPGQHLLLREKIRELELPIDDVPAYKKVKHSLDQLLKAREAAKINPFITAKDDLGVEQRAKDLVKAHERAQKTWHSLTSEKTARQTTLLLSESHEHVYRLTLPIDHKSNADPNASYTLFEQELIAYAESQLHTIAHGTFHQETDRGLVSYLFARGESDRRAIIARRLRQSQDETVFRNLGIVVDIAWFQSTEDQAKVHEHPAKKPSKRDLHEETRLKVLAYLRRHQGHAGYMTLNREFGKTQLERAELRETLDALIGDGTAYREGRSYSLVQRVDATTPAGANKKASGIRPKKGRLLGLARPVQRLGKPVDPENQRIYDAIYLALDARSSDDRPGATADELLTALRESGIAIEKKTLQARLGYLVQREELASERDGKASKYHRA